MTICDCGCGFSTFKTADLVFYHGYLFACDVRRCAKCHKQVLQLADAPLAVTGSEEAYSIIASADKYGKTVWGKE